MPDGYIDPDQLRKYHDLTAQQQASMARSARKKEVVAAVDWRGNGLR